MAPFITSFGGKLAAGFLLGIIFGFTIQKAKMTRYETLIGQLRLKDFTMVKVMFTAIIVGMAGIYFFRDLGILKLSVKATDLGADVIGATIFGIGFALLGYCPTTAIGAVGEGRMDALWGGLLGMLTGAALYAEAYQYLKPTILSWGAYGKITIPSALGIEPPYHWIIILVLAAAVISLFRLLEKKGL